MHSIDNVILFVVVVVSKGGNSQQKVIVFCGQVEGDIRVGTSGFAVTVTSASSRQLSSDQRTMRSVTAVSCVVVLQ
jgi:hypothetical protein